jgi:hypothetical protein
LICGCDLLSVFILAAFFASCDFPNICPTIHNPLGVISLSSLSTTSIFAFILFHPPGAAFAAVLYIYYTIFFARWVGFFEGLFCGLRDYFEEILNIFKSRMTNAVCEGINSMIQAAKRKARDFHTFEGFSSMIYLIAAKLNLAFPNPLRFSE